MDADSSPNVTPTTVPYASKLLWLLLVVAIIGFMIAGAVQLVDRKPVADRYVTVQPIALETETGKGFGAADLSDGSHFTILDFIFTRCGGQCPQMSAQMASVQRYAVEQGWNAVRFVSVTVDPDNDTTEVLQSYGKRFGAMPDRWSFVRGDVAKVYPWARELLLETKANPGGSARGEEEFIHSNKFLVIDPKGVVRAYYAGNDAEDVERLKKELPTLLRGWRN